jgi:hypothetical protein
MARKGHGKTDFFSKSLPKNLNGLPGAASKPLRINSFGCGGGFELHARIDSRYVIDSVIREIGRNGKTGNLCSPLEIIER